MDNEFPLYPKLSEEAAKEAQLLIDGFKVSLVKAAEEAISELYTDIIPCIESDSWGNFRQQLLSGLQNYGNRKIQAAYDFKKIRQAIYEEFRDEIIVDLNQDLVEENEKLKKQLEQEREWNRRHDG